MDPKEFVDRGITYCTSAEPGCVTYPVITLSDSSNWYIDYGMYDSPLGNIFLPHETIVGTGAIFYKGEWSENRGLTCWYKANGKNSFPVRKKASAYKKENFNYMWRLKPAMGRTVASYECLSSDGNVNNCPIS